MIIYCYILNITIQYNTNTTAEMKKNKSVYLLVVNIFHLFYRMLNV